MTITGDYQLEFDGLKIGDTTDYDLVSADGFGMPDIRSTDLELVGRDGLHPGIDRMGGRFIDLSLQVDGMANMAALGQAFSPSDPESASGATERPLTFQLPGVAGGGVRRIMCRPRAMDTPIGLQRVHGDFADASILLAATDPLFYDEAAKGATILLPAGGNGLTFPLTFPLTWGTIPDGNANCQNDGNFRTGVTMRIDGPCTNPRITNAARSKTLEFAIDIAAGDYLLVDTVHRTVQLNGNANRYYTLTADSEWWSLAPGQNDVQFRATTGTGASLAIAWRDAWIY